MSWVEHSPHIRRTMLSTPTRSELRKFAIFQVGWIELWPWRLRWSNYNNKKKSDQQQPVPEIKLTIRQSLFTIRDLVSTTVTSGCDPWSVTKPSNLCVISLDFLDYSSNATHHNEAKKILVSKAYYISYTTLSIEKARHLETNRSIRSKPDLADDRSGRSGIIIEHYIGQKPQ